MIEWNQRKVRFARKPEVRRLAIVTGRNPLHFVGESFHVAPEADVFDYGIGVTQIKGIVSEVKGACITYCGGEDVRRIVDQPKLHFSEVDNRNADVLSLKKLEAEAAPICDLTANIENPKRGPFPGAIGNHISQQGIAALPKVVR